VVVVVASWRCSAGIHVCATLVGATDRQVAVVVVVASWRCAADIHVSATLVGAAGRQVAVVTTVTAAELKAVVVFAVDQVVTVVVLFVLTGRAIIELTVDTCFAVESVEGAVIISGRITAIAHVFAVRRVIQAALGHVGCVVVAYVVVTCVVVTRVVITRVVVTRVVVITSHAVGVACAVLIEAVIGAVAVVIGAISAVTWVSTLRLDLRTADDHEQCNERK